VRDADHEWTTQHSEYERHLDLFESKGTPFLYGASFNYTENLVIAGGGTGRNEVRVFNYDDGRLVSAIFNIPMSVLSVDSAKTSDGFAFGCSDASLRLVNIVKRT
jgi:hypothetical protein